MNIYEGMFVLDDRRANDNWDGVVAEVRGLLEKHQARVLTLARWDERRLAYRIKGRSRGVYMLTRFTAPGEAIQPIERDCQLSDTILRVLLLRDHASEKDRDLGPPDGGEPDGELEPVQAPAEAEATPAQPAADGPAEEPTPESPPAQS